MSDSVTAIDRRYRRNVGFAVIMGLFVAAPMIGITFVGDDALRANVDGWLAVHHATLTAAFREELLRDDLSMGRFHPLFVAFTLVEMHLSHDPFALKVAQVLAVGSNVATVAFVVRVLTRSSSRALVAATISVVTLQLRDVSDATNGSSLHLQLTAEFAMLAVGLLAFSVGRVGLARNVSYALSVVSFALALLLYEITIPFVVPLVVLCAIGFTTWRTRVVSALPYLLIAATHLAAIAYVRHTWPPGPHSFYAPSGGVPFLDACFWQLASTIPLLYEYVDPQHVFHATGTYWPLAVVGSIAILCAIVGYGSSHEASTPDRGRSERLVVGVAVALACFAGGAMVAASPVYQHIIRPALPYAPVYVQGFGLAVVCATVVPLRTVSRRAGRWLAAAWFVVCLVLFVSNVIVMRQFDAIGDARATIVAGLRHGAAADVPVDALVYLDGSYYWINGNSYDGDDDTPGLGPMLWDSRYFYRLWAGRTWRTRPLARENLRDGQTAYELRTAANSSRAGTLIVERVRGRTGATPIVESAILFERGTPPHPGPPKIASQFASDDFRTIARGATWQTTAFESHALALPDDAIVKNSPSSAHVDFGAGFSVAENDGVRQWRWGSSRATLSVVNPFPRPLATELHATVGTVSPARGTVTMTNAMRKTNVMVDGRLQRVEMSFVLSPRSHAVVDFYANAPNVALAGDARDLRFRLVDVTLVDRARVRRGGADIARRTATRDRPSPAPP